MPTFEALGKAISAYKARHPKSTPEEILIFIDGWTAFEIAYSLKDE